jgi:hypothetical protein
MTPPAHLQAALSDLLGDAEPWEFRKMSLYHATR